MLSIKKLAAKRRAKAIKRQKAHRGKIQLRKTMRLKVAALKAIFNNPELRAKFLAHQKALENAKTEGTPEVIPEVNSSVPVATIEESKE